MKKYFTLAPIFHDNMMFQAHKPIRLYGKCKKNIEITVKFLEQEQTIKTNSEEFIIELNQEDYHEKGFSFTLVSKKQTETIYNCMIGDVYLFIGGKNITQSLSMSSKIEDYTSSDLRFIDLSKEKKWLVSNRDPLDQISVLAYLFTKNIHQQHRVPLGIVIYGKDDENIFSWSNESVILNDKEMKNYLNGVFQKTDYHLARDYNSLKKDVFSYAFKSIIIYQGENDFPHYHFYEKALNSLIRTYRMELKDIFLPIHIIQVSSFKGKHRHYIASSEIRIAQSNLCSDKSKVFVISVVDIDEEETVSLNKNILSQRLVKLVLEKIYNVGKNSLCPQLFSYRQRFGQVDIYFHNNFLSLVSKSGQKLGFYYTDNTVDYYPVKDILIENNQISIKVCEDVKEIRYAYDDNPTCDIYTSNGLPLLPFKIVLDEAS